MTDDQFMVPVLNRLTNVYELQMLLLEKWIGSKENPLTIDTLKEELSLRNERLLMKTETAKVEIAVKSVKRLHNGNQSR
jgi:hypothetical protein